MHPGHERQLSVPLNGLTAFLRAPTFPCRRIAHPSEAIRCMAIRAKLTALLGALLAGVLILISGVAPASAHAGHNHASKATVQAPTPVAAVAAPVEAVVSTVLDEVQGPTGQGAALADLTTTPAKIPMPVHQGNCCCGSIACHAGVEAPAPAAVEPAQLSAKVEPVPVLGAAKFNPHGIDRPPRRLPL
jgi:hypothetical protein